MRKRNKYTYSFKLQCVEAILKEHRPILSLANESGVNPSNLKLWVDFYKKYGVSGLYRKNKQSYDVAFKFNVIETMDKECLSLRSACVRFNIASESTIIRWRRAYESEGLSGLTTESKKMPPPIKRKPRKSDKPLTAYQELLLENERLKAENELLKKLQALTQTNKKHKP